MQTVQFVTIPSITHSSNYTTKRYCHIWIDHAYIAKINVRKEESFSTNAETYINKFDKAQTKFNQSAHTSYSQIDWFNFIIYSFFVVIVYVFDIIIV